PIKRMKARILLMGPRTWRRGPGVGQAGRRVSIRALARDRKPTTPRLSMEHLDEVEEQIELLKVAYERYFNGVDRVPPAREHDAVRLSVRRLFGLHTGSTAVRFRAQGLKARLVTYEQYWTRILGQIERGTFKRILAESKRREMECRHHMVAYEVPSIALHRQYSHTCAAYATDWRDV